VRRSALVLLVLVLAACNDGEKKDAGSAAPPAAETAASITPASMREHLEAFQQIADRHGRTRASDTPGHAASVEYVLRALRGDGLHGRLDRFPLDAWREVRPAELEIASGPDVTVPEVETMQYSPSGAVTAPLAPVDLGEQVEATEASTSGCEGRDFGTLREGDVALVQRGGCFLFDKAHNAERAGASAVIVMNGGTPGNTNALQGTLARPGTTIPVVGVSFETGAALAHAAAAGPLEVALRVETEMPRVTGTNVLAEIPGSGDGIVLLGAHLDSVPAGPGLNDNASGAAALLEVAAALADTHPERTIRFAFWDAEELGLIGSSSYVSRLPKDELDDIEAVVNVDMVGSPNGGSFVFDGDGSSGFLPGPDGSENIEAAFEGAFAALDLPAAPADLELGRTDSAPFTEAGIPVGGVFSGADGAKSAAEAEEFGGEAGEPYDPCYHQACDRVGDVDLELAAGLARAVALATASLAQG
jgi:Zn-dependent M28 family amino/carboxypeptidase